MAAEETAQPVAIALIRAHIPSLTLRDEVTITRGAVDLVASAFSEREADVADLAVRTCACGKHLDGFYEYVDHLIAVFGGESHYGG